MGEIRGNLIIDGKELAVTRVKVLDPPTSGTFTITGPNTVTGEQVTTRSLRHDAKPDEIAAAMDEAGMTRGWRQQRAEPVRPRAHARAPRNHPCPCGSGVKFKKC